MAGERRAWGAKKGEMAAKFATGDEAREVGFVG